MSATASARSRSSAATVVDIEEMGCRIVADGIRIQLQWNRLQQSVCGAVIHLQRAGAAVRDVNPVPVVTHKDGVRNLDSFDRPKIFAALQIEDQHLMGALRGNEKPAALLIDAKNERAAAWYASYGVLPLLDAALSLVLPLAVATDALKRGEAGT